MAYDTRRNSQMASNPRQYYDSSNTASDSYHDDSQPNPSTAPRDNQSESQYIPASFPPPPSHPPPSTQPIQDAVNHAFDNSTDATQLSPELVARITEQVVSSLRAELNGGASANQPASRTSRQAGMQIPAYIPPPPPNPPPVSNSRPAPPPSSPGHMRDPSQPFIAPGSIPGSGSTAGMYSTRTSSPEFYASPRASFTRSDPDTAPRDIPIRSRPDMPFQPDLKENLMDRYGERSREGSQTDRRPSPARVLTSDEETVVEKMWQPLFDANSNPTIRLHQFLRGVALHIMETFEPKNSIVVGPKKMRKFYDRMKVAEEPYSWGAIFDLPNDQLSKLYSSLSSTHHLIPRSSNPYESPLLPGLTPHGFANFVTIFILASPDVEFERLAATVRDWPVSNADERKERWPKELSRRLFPKTASEAARRRLNDALSRVGISTRPAYVPPPPSSAQPASQPNYSSSAPSAYVTPITHRERRASRRNSYRPPAPVNVSSPRVASDYDTDTSFSSDDDTARRPSIPIERERKPYTAKAGSGKVHDDPHNMTRSKSNSIPATAPIPTNLTRSTSRSEAGSMPPSSAPNRERARSSATNYTNSSNKRSNRDRSPSYPSNGFQYVSDIPPQPGYPQQHPVAPEERYHAAADMERHGSRDSNLEAEHRYAKYSEDYRTGRTGGYAVGGAAAYAGNPGLGTGERRY